MKKPEPDFIIDAFMLGLPVLRHIEGKLLTVIESLGLGDKQEDATKSILRTTFWDVVNDFGIPITEKEHQEKLSSLPEEEPRKTLLG